MSSPESLVSYESFKDEVHHTIRRHKSSACLGGRRRTSNLSTTNHAFPYACRASHYKPQQSTHCSNTSSGDERVSARPNGEASSTEFTYVGSMERGGWKAGQVPLILEWYPEKLDRRSTHKFFESGREYVIGRSPACDIYFQNAEPDSGISAQHLKIKVPLPSSPLSPYVNVRLSWFPVR